MLMSILFMVFWFWLDAVDNHLVYEQLASFQQRFINKFSTVTGCYIWPLIPVKNAR